MPGYDLVTPHARRAFADPETHGHAVDMPLPAGRLWKVVAGRLWKVVAGRLVPIGRRVAPGGAASSTTCMITTGLSTTPRSRLHEVHDHGTL